MRKTGSIIFLLLSFLMLESLTATAQEKEKKIRKRTKIGTGVGAAGGAAIGALVSKNNVAGALIGAAVGGAAGNLIGRKMDKQAEALKEAIPNAEVERVGEGISLTFDSGLLFRTGSADLSESAQADLAKFAEVLQQYPDTDLLIEGHTDSSGSDELNMELSQKRAMAVSNYLKIHNVNGARITEKWYGKTKPKVPNDTPENMTINRRVEVAIMANEEMKKQAQNGELKIE
jgi:outer membrane protein OmpA-like peptidoglycan-associated protein